MRKLTSIFLGLALVLSACGGDGGTSTVASGAAADDRPASFDDLEFNSPIGEFLGFDFTDSDNMEAQFEEMEREAARLTTQCMLDKGFQYTPETQGMISFGGPGGDELPYFSDAWVDKYGFGITTQRFPQSSVGDLVGFPDEQFEEPDEGFVDPNQEYVESLSEGERQAYHEALWGTGPNSDTRFDEDGGQGQAFQPSGCQGEAMEEAFSGGPGGGMAFYEAFGDELNDLQLRAEADPRYVEFTNEVTACVSDKGMTWVDQEELYERFEPQLNDLQPAGFTSGDPFEGTGLNPEEMSDREIDEFFQELNRLDPANFDALAELQTEELALARVVIDCGGGPLNEQWILGDVRAEYEQQFLDENADALTEFGGGS